MRKSKELTKQMLQDNFKITNVTRDGRIFKGDQELVQKENVITHKYGETQIYKVVTVADRSEKIYKEFPHNRTWWAYKVKRLLVHRIVYAWYNGIVHAGYEIDHIDNNTTNNNIENLRELSTQENRAKKTVSRNQYTAGLTDEEILERRKNIKTYYDRKLHKTLYRRKSARNKDTVNVKATANWHKTIKQIKELEEQNRINKANKDMIAWRKTKLKIEKLKIKKIKYREEE